METLELIRTTFAGRRVLVTGHTGFKGSWLSLWLTRLGADVAGYSLAPESQPALFTLASASGAIDSTLADVCDLEALQSTVSRFRPEIIFHLAAQSLVRRSYRTPVDTFATNVMGTVHVLEAARRADCVKAIVVVSSDKCYRNIGTNMPAEGFTEASPFGGADPYSSSKACTELVTDAYRSSFFAPGRPSEQGTAVASARAGNVIGGGDWAEDRLVPDMIRAFVEKKPAIIRNPSAIRPWQHVLDPLWGYLLLAARLIQHGQRYARGWNFGPAGKDSLPVSALADTLTAAWGDESCWDSSPHASSLTEAHTLLLDSKDAHVLLGWQPAFSLAQSLRDTAVWYRRWAAGVDARELCLDTIARYEMALSRMPTQEHG